MIVREAAHAALVPLGATLELGETENDQNGALDGYTQANTRFAQMLPDVRSEYGKVVPLVVFGSSPHRREDIS